MSTRIDNSELEAASNTVNAGFDEHSAFTTADKSRFEIETTGISTSVEGYLVTRFFGIESGVESA